MTPLAHHHLFTVLSNEEIWETSLGIRAQSRNLKDLLTAWPYLCFHFRKAGDFIDRKKSGKLMVS